ncbi:MAG: 16S rRNA (cytidine(1402)-2'-O)-methyltransferase, partial [Syntrophomonadaceae bacterium]
MKGKIYVCGTPIGNLEDVSIRLLKTLRKVDLIACEDTRHTIKLLNRYKIKNKLVSYHEFSRPGKTSYLLEQLARGLSVALVSDAGMPAISDPGNDLVRRATEAGFEVEVIPGPSACTAALAIAGIDSSSFIFAGFLPAKPGKRRETLTSFKGESRTVILYEAPHRLVATLADMATVLGEKRPIIVARELTKLHQEVQRGTVKEVLCYYQQNQPRGEICLLLPAPEDEDLIVDMEAVMRETQELIRGGMEKKQAFKLKASQYNIPKSTIYARFI